MPRGMNPGPGCKSAQFLQGSQGWPGPPGRCAINLSVHGPGGTCSEITESCKEDRVPPGAVAASAPAMPAACGRPAPLARAGPGSEQQSESCHWATRFTGPLQVSTPRLPERTGRSMPEPGYAAR